MIYLEKQTQGEKVWTQSDDKFYHRCLLEWSEYLVSKGM